jgi:hypothetical protein
MAVYQKKHSPNRAYNLNSFRLSGLEKIKVGYRLISPTGLLQEDDDYEKKIRLATTVLSGKIKMPVEPIYSGDETQFAVIGLEDELNKLKIPEEIALNPEVISLSIEDKIHPLNFQSRLAHSHLLYEMVGVDGTDEGKESPHNESIMSSAKRGTITEKVIKAITPHLELFGQKLQPSYKMRRLDKEVTVFPPPTLQFGKEEELTTDLKNMSRDRFDALRYFGPAQKSNFADKQLFIEVESLPEDVRRDFKKGLNNALTDLCGKAPAFKTITVNDNFSYLLREQYNEIMDAIGEQKGYGLLILPKERVKGQQSKLHNKLKRDLWKQVHTQCASAEKILEFYKKVRDKFGEERWVIKSEKHRLYKSYLRYLALGYLEVNCQWLWKFAEGTLRNEVHIGIDVYKGLAVFTFIYGDGELITFHLSSSKRPERLSADQIYAALFENLRKDLKSLGICPSRIVIQRDGRTFESEKIGIKRCFKDIKNLVSSDFKYAIVDIHKTSSSKSRLYLNFNGRYSNPRMGAFAELSKFEGVLATTGEPVLRRGTAQPLYLDLVEGDIDLIDVAHDIYALSHLSFASPGSAMGLPFTIALGDRILRESSPGEDIPLWEDEEEKPKIVKHKTAVRSFV